MVLLVGGVYRSYSSNDINFYMVKHFYRFRSRADFDPNDWRLTVPRFSEENFPKILKVVDALIEIAKKYPGTTSSSVTLAWIMAEHKDSKRSRYSDQSVSLNFLI